MASMYFLRIFLVLIHILLFITGCVVLELFLIFRKNNVKKFDEFGLNSVFKDALDDATNNIFNKNYLISRRRFGTIIFGLSCLAGIGFTITLSMLAFADDELDLEFVMTLWNIDVILCVVILFIIVPIGLCHKYIKFSSNLMIKQQLLRVFGFLFAWICFGLLVGQMLLNEMFFQMNVGHITFILMCTLYMCGFGLSFIAILVGFSGIYLPYILFMVHVDVSSIRQLEHRISDSYRAIRHIKSKLKEVTTNEDPMKEDLTSEARTDVPSGMRNLDGGSERSEDGNSEWSDDGISEWNEEEGAGMMEFYRVSNYHDKISRLLSTSSSIERNDFTERSEVREVYPNGMRMDLKNEVMKDGASSSSLSMEMMTLSSMTRQHPSSFHSSMLPPSSFHSECPPPASSSLPSSLRSSDLPSSFHSEFSSSLRSSDPPPSIYRQIYSSVLTILKDTTDLKCIMTSMNESTDKSSLKNILNDIRDELEYLKLIKEQKDSNLKLSGRLLSFIKHLIAIVCAINCLIISRRVVLVFMDNTERITKEGNTLVLTRIYYTFMEDDVIATMLNNVLVGIELPTIFDFIISRANIIFLACVIVSNVGYFFDFGRLLLRTKYLQKKKLLTDNTIGLALSGFFILSFPSQFCLVIPFLPYTLKHPIFRLMFENNIYVWFGLRHRFDVYVFISIILTFIGILFIHYNKSIRKRSEYSACNV